jgi:hypothetical protein
MKRVALILSLVTVAVFVVLVLVRGARADRCAETLVADIAKKDRAALEKALRTPSLPDELLAAHEVELGFVRPISSEETRVGLFVLRTATATRADVVSLMLEAEPEDGACTFLRDYESGAFAE